MILCKLFHCLPSQLEKEDAKTIGEFLDMNNELIFQEMEKIREMEAEARLRRSG